MSEKSKAKGPVDNIHTAIIAVMKDVGYVQKVDKVNFGSTKYSYASEAALIAAMRPAMLANDITFHCSGIEVLNSNRSDSVRCKYTYTFTHAPTLSYVLIEVLGEGQDKGDKASYKAATGALKYALRQTFIIETGDDPDKTSTDELIEKEKEAKALSRKRKQDEEKKQEEYQKAKFETINKINDMAKDMAEDQNVGCEELLFLYSGYMDTEGVAHKGVHTFKGIGDAQLQATLLSFTVAYKEWRQEVEKKSKKSLEEHENLFDPVVPIKAAK